MIDTASIVICSLFVIYIAYAALRLDLRERKGRRLLRQAASEKR